MSLAAYLGVVLTVAAVVAALMEPWARILHGGVWHSALWSIHRSHHAPRHGRFERNDVLSAVHAPVAMTLIIVGCQLPRAMPSALCLGVGAGMTAFGLAYTLVHDGLVHGRLPVGRRHLLRLRGLREIRRAQVVHHSLGGVPYGLFRGPAELNVDHDRRSPRSSASARGGAGSPGVPPSAPSPAGREPA